jgi:hypothetical protein
VIAAESDTIYLVSDVLDAVTDLAARINDLRARIRALDEQRTALSEELEESLSRLAVVAGGPSGPTTQSARIDDQIIRLLRRHEGRHLTPRDIADALKLPRAADLAYLRVRLSRLTAAGKVNRVGHGRYASPAQG